MAAETRADHIIRLDRRVRRLRDALAELVTATNAVLNADLGGWEDLIRARDEAEAALERAHPTVCDCASAARTGYAGPGGGDAMTVTTPTLDDPCCELGYCVWCDNAGDGGALGSVVAAERTPRGRAISNMACQTGESFPDVRAWVRYVRVLTFRESWERYAEESGSDKRPPEGSPYAWMHEGYESWEFVHRSEPRGTRCWIVGFKGEGTPHAPAASTCVGRTTPDTSAHEEQTHGTT